MLLAKKAQQAAATPATPAAGGDASASADAPASGGAGKISLLGGDEGRAGGSTSGTRRKMKPGEIRVQKDIAELDAGSTGKVTWPDPTDLTKMKLAITPDKGLWSGATFEFSISIPDMYPHEPPKVMCLTPIYHPNIDAEGKVCLNILRDEWKPIYDTNTVIYGIIYLFYEPNPNDPLNHDAAKIMREDIRTFESNVRTSLRGGRVGDRSFPRLL